jgi:hypothetical protein
MQLCRQSGCDLNGMLVKLTNVGTVKWPFNPKPYTTEHRMDDPAMPFDNQSAYPGVKRIQQQKGGLTH